MIDAIFRGSKGSSGAFKQNPDNLRSNDTFEGVLGVGIGPMKGPTNGLKSIKIDGTAVENATGQLNFNDFLVTIGDGDPLKFPQQVNLKLGAGAAPTSVGLSLTNTTGSNPVWVTKTINNVGADYLDLRFIVNQLYRQDKKGIYDATATLEIQMKPVGKTNWINPVINNPTGTYNPQGQVVGLAKYYIAQQYYNTDGTWKAPTSNGYQITGKTTSPAVYELRLAVPNEGVYANTAWDVRVRLLERETYTGGTDNVDQEKRTITWESISAVYSTALGTHEDWRGVTWMQVYGKASDQLTGVPEVTGEWDTKIISVPPSSLFNPTTRVYTAGTWDGSFAKAFTNDPAWIINDAISDSLSGLSLVAPGSYLNKWDALEASKWFSELVSDGNGGTEPRYSLNLAISQPQKAEEFIRYLSGAVGALAWDQGDGEWRLKCDKPDVPVDLFTLDNIEGEFVYSHTDVDTRYNDIIGQFKNKEMDYRQDAVRLFDNASIAKIGRKPTTIALVGCTGRQEAMRRVKLRLESTVNESKIVNFTTNRRGRNVDHLDLILVSDADLGPRDQRTQGRCIAISADRKTITLRDPVYLAQGITYTLRFTSPNASYQATATTQPPTQWKKPTLASQRTVTNANAARGAVTVLTLDTALPSDIDANLTVALEAAGLVTTPKLYRVTNVVYDEDGERVSISALEINIAKWTNSDNVSKADTVFQDLRGAVPMPEVVPGRPLLTLNAIPIEQGKQVNLQANWVRPAGAFLSGFRVQFSVNGGALQTAVERTQLGTWELPNALPGLYRVEVSTMDRRGGYSKPLVGTLQVTQSMIGSTDIKYGNGDTLESVKPAEAGADKTSNNTSKDTNAVGGTPAVNVLSTIELNGRNILGQTLRGDGLKAAIDAFGYIDGKTVASTIAEIKTQMATDAQSYAQNFTLLGAKNANGTGWSINGDSVEVTGTGLKALSLANLALTTDENSGTITRISDILIDDTGATLRSIDLMDLNGNITGKVNTLTGATSEYSIYANVFKIVNPNGGQPFTPFQIAADGTVEMISVKVKTLSYEALVPLFGGENNRLDPTSGFQVLPGGLILQWGRLRQAIRGEANFSVTFPKVFPTAVMSVQAIGYISSFSISRDLWVQNVGSPSVNGATFCTQAADANAQNLDGIDWFAVGY